MLSDGGSSVKELQKAGIRLKTIRLKKTGRTREAMSFQSFDYCEIAQQEWEESAFCDALEDKFLFAIFQEDEDGVEHFAKAEYWNMPYQDRLLAQEVWEETKERILAGNYTFPQSSENQVSHVRPHARNAEDKIMCPDGEMRMKRSFWLNQRYIEQVVSSL
jgi:DNA mismatch repair protein MutH